MPNNFIQVAVGVIKNPAGQILIALRDLSAHQGGLWEFPGGKVEAGESVEAALVRELKEELGITVQAVTPLINIKHQYPDLAVELKVFTVDHFTGEAKSCEGQPLKWVDASELKRYAFPKANQHIVTAAMLPDCYAILDDSDAPDLMANLRHLLSQNIKLIQARLKRSSPEAVSEFLTQAYPLCQAHRVILLINSAVSGSHQADGLHLTSHDLLACRERPQNYDWVAASCHSLEQLQHAENIGLDFAVLAPVLPTQTHPEAKALGWELVVEWLEEVNLPVYALGGMALPLLPSAKQAGARGIAAIRAFLA